MSDPAIYSPTLADSSASTAADLGDCLACGGATTNVLRAVVDTRFAVPGRWDIHRCGRCGLEQTLPRPTGAELGRLYAAHYNFGGERDTRYVRWRERFFASPLYRLWLAIDGDISFHRVPGQGRLLDVGCNEGRGLAQYRAAGFAVVEGLETNPVAAAAAAARGFAVHRVDIGDHRPDKPYDVIVLSNVLEHALDPAAMLAEIARLLRPGGEVRISCPNAASWLRRLFGRDWINWHVPFHITHFTAATLTETVRRAGFAPTAMANATPGLWVAHSLIAALGARPDRPTRLLRKAPVVMAAVVLARGLLFPLLWAGDRLGRGDCLVLRATRP